MSPALRHHLLRHGAFGALLLAAVSMGSVPLAAASAVGLFLAAFAFNHDAMHGALGLSRRQGDAAMLAAGALMGMSGHAIRVMHMLHHARPLSDEDMEGAAARMPMERALLQSPRLSWAMRRDAWRRSGARGRRWQAAEAALNVAGFVALVVSGQPALWAVAAVGAALQLFMPAWAGHIPHRCPPWLLALARALSPSRSHVVLSLAYHAEHHARPRVPCEDLGLAA
ncbi:MAG: fatty acid desaturase [Alphaproteobacteria bacterium]|nr:fatty acid desaturase [Alphaproteobacteria bacterium]